MLAGEGISSITNDWTARGITNMSGGKWQRQTLRAVVMSARVAGWREHTPGRTTTDRANWQGGEFTAPAQWEPILDRPRSSASGRHSATERGDAGSSVLSYVLSGLLKCGECGANMTGRPRHGGGREYQYPEQVGCRVGVRKALGGGRVHRGLRDRGRAQGGRVR